MYWEPLVACVTVTNGSCLFRRKMIGAAAQALQAQTYPNWIWIVINHGEWLDAAMLMQDSGRVFERQVETAKLGKLRNQGIKFAEECQAKLLVSWDDDDWSAPDRLRMQVAGTVNNMAASFAGYTVLDLEKGSTFIRSMAGFDNRCAAGLMMFPIGDGYLYPETTRHEDSAMCKKYLLGGRLKVLDNHCMYVRTGHPFNTSGRAHVLTKWGNDRQLTADQQVLVGSGVRALTKHYTAYRELGDAVDGGG